jgi:hydrogenase nickel incorporation protein HypA/HybF
VFVTAGSAKCLNTERFVRRSRSRRRAWQSNRPWYVQCTTVPLVDAALLVAGREEFGIAHQVIEICAAASGGARITRVVLEIGKLSAVLPDAVRFCFDAATEGTPAEGAELEIIEVPGLVRCEDCGREMTRDRPLGHCACGGSSFESLAGDELRIKAMDVNVNSKE